MTAPLDTTSSKQLSDDSRISIMTTVEAGTAGDHTHLGGGLLKLPKSRSIDDLRSFSQRSITWSDQRDEPKERREEEGEGVDEKDKEGEGGGGQEIEGPQLVTVDACGDQEVESIESSHVECPLPPAITAGRVSEATLQPFSSSTLELVFAPEAPGSHAREFEVQFSELGVSTIALRAFGEGLELPVYVEREVVDMQICMVGRLYQESIVVHNRWVSGILLSLV